ncbi:MAG: hypothetical protein RIT27_519 [Pseudomonadota bacterium]
MASGQALASSYFSANNITGADLTDGTKWSSIGCGGAIGSGTISMGSGDIMGICSGKYLALSATDTVTAGTLMFGGWNGSVLKFNSGNKTIVNRNSSLASIALNVSSMTTGNTITISASMGGQNVTFSSVTGGSLACPTGTPYTAGTAITAGTTCTVTVTPPTPAPIDFSFNKQVETFATEIEINK